MWPIDLSVRLPIAGSVGRYPADYLMGRDPISHRESFHPANMCWPDSIRY